MSSKVHKNFLIYSLTTSYIKFESFQRSHFVHVLNSELVKRGIQMKVITPHSKGLKRREFRNDVLIRRFRYLPEKYQLNDLSVPEASTVKKGRLKIFFMICIFFLFTFFECIKQKPKIIHGHWAFPSGYIAYLISKIFRKKFIVTIHGSEIPLLKKFTLLKKLVIPALNKSSNVIANSEYAKDELIKMGVRKEKIIKIRVTPDFVEHENDHQVLEKFRKNFTDPSTKIILFIGRLVEVKGVEYLIKALLEIKNVKVHLIIVGDGMLKIKLQELAKSLSLNEKITFFGMADRKKLGLLHGISDVLVCPSIIYGKDATEGLPMVIPEAMESQLPVVASSVGGIVDIIKNEINGLLVTQKDPKSLAKGIEKILLDDELKKKLIENEKDTLKEFLPEIIAQKYLDLFEVIDRR